ncbi:Bug family tripartite tricarboxylate transporter substrate binding protein [Xinfangfangia pollutisoli]|uniref:Bug family tripartite tricarboxylate transporter substrate binding protein n=1 Tax=Xinfangfangia pollutisoli TaxID=2865960 RepID=UPI001CD2868E|nr:tripartite tricarboxylate transporter substrate-binding protein [Xinfangfangia pollutisoli]
MNKTATGLLAVLATAFGLSAAHAQAEDYPSKPITLILPYAPGGGTDAVANVFADRLAQALGQPVIKENHPGSNSIIGTALLAEAEPDGHTLLVVTSALSINPYIYAQMPYETPAAFAPVTILTDYPFVLGIRQGLPFTDIKGLVDYAKANPGVLTAGTPGRGASVQLALGLLNTAAGIEIRDIPFKGSGESLNAVAGGFVDMVFSGYETVRPFAESGRLSMIGSTGTEPFGAEGLPPIGGVVEGYQFTTWLALIAPAGTPPEVVEKLNLTLKEIFAEPEVQQKLKALNVNPVVNAPDEALAYITAQMAFNKSIVESIGLRPE